MKQVVLVGVAFLASSLDATAQEKDNAAGEVAIYPPFNEIGDVVVAKGIQLETIDQAEVIDVILSTAPEGLTLAHPAEILNTIAGVNIHRGSGQEHLSAIRSPVLTGGGWCGKLSLYAGRCSIARGGLCKCKRPAGSPHRDCGSP